VNVRPLPGAAISRGALVCTLRRRGRDDVRGVPTVGARRVLARTGTTLSGPARKRPRRPQPTGRHARSAVWPAHVGVWAGGGYVHTHATSYRNNLSSMSSTLPRCVDVTRTDCPFGACHARPRAAQNDALADSRTEHRTGDLCGTTSSTGRTRRSESRSSKTASRYQTACFMTAAHDQVSVPEPRVRLIGPPAYNGPTLSICVSLTQVLTAG
jgi:hypothetical protein